jgi:hypothetical protein
MRLHELLQLPSTVLTVVDRLEEPSPKSFSEITGIDPIAFVLSAEAFVLTRIADDELRNVRLKKIVQPARQGPFLEGQVHPAWDGANERDERRWLGLGHGFHDHLAARLLTTKLVVALWASAPTYMSSAIGVLLGVGGS